MNATPQTRIEYKDGFKRGLYGFDTSERYLEMKRKLLESVRLPCTMFNDFEDICRRFGFPEFFILDWVAYQMRNGWNIDGRPISNPPGAFYKYANARRERMLNNEDWRGCLWHGENINDWIYCGILDDTPFDSYCEMVQDMEHERLETQSESLNN